MVKQIIFGVKDSNNLKRLLCSNTLTIGFIVGHHTSSDKDYIAKLIVCPPEVLHVERQNEVVDVDEVDEFRFTCHASKIVTCLPGGMWIIGIFVSTKSLEINKVSMKLYTLASRVREKLLQALGGVSEYLDDTFIEKMSLWTLLHFDQRDLKVLSCKQFDLSVSVNDGRAADLRITESSINWTSLHSACQIVQGDISDFDYLNVNAFHNICKRVSSAILIINAKTGRSHQLLGSKNLAGKSQSAKNKLKKQQKMLALQCKIILPITSVGIAVDERSFNSKSCKIDVVGSILTKAYLPPGSTMKTATEALKFDIIRSLAYRRAMLAGGHWESFCWFNCPLYSRVFAKDMKFDNGISYSAYICPGHPINECVHQFQEVLGITADITCVAKEYKSKFYVAGTEELSDEYSSKTGNVVKTALTMDTSKNISSFAKEEGVHKVSKVMNTINEKNVAISEKRQSDHNGLRLPIFLPLFVALAVIAVTNLFYYP